MLSPQTLSSRSRAVLRVAFTFVLVLCGMGVARSQPVNVTVNVTPPYSPYLGDYTSGNKVLLTLQNLAPTQRKIKLIGTITGDNGVEIKTNPSYTPPDPIILQPNQTRTLYSNELSKFLDPNNVTTKGVNKQQLQMGKALPEGNYQFCFQAVDYVTGASLSSPAPSGCSPTLNMLYYDPPKIVTPACGVDLVTEKSSLTTFSWLDTKPANIPWTYWLRLKEVPDGKNPNEVMSNASYPYLVNQKYSQSPVVLSLSMVPLVSGKKYAVQIYAEDNNTKTQIRNGGNGEVCWFIYKIAVPAPQKNSDFVLKSPENKSVIDPDSLKGHYFWFQWKTLPNEGKSKWYYSLKVVKVNNGQTPEEAIAKNPAFLGEDTAGTEQVSTFYKQYVNLSPPQNQKYAWRVLAIKSGVPALVTDVWTFTVSTDKTPPTHFDSLQKNHGLVRTFAMGDHIVTILKWQDTSFSNWSGIGSCSLWPGGPTIEFPYSGLKLRLRDPKKETIAADAIATEGKMISNKTFYEIPVAFENASNGSATYRASYFSIEAKTAGGISTGVMGVNGYIHWPFPLPLATPDPKGYNALENNASWIGLTDAGKPFGTLQVSPASGKQSYSTAAPIEAVVMLTSVSLDLPKTGKSVPTYTGSVDMNKIHTVKWKSISFPFKDIHEFYFSGSFAEGNQQYHELDIRPIPNSEIVVQPITYIVDLVENKSNAGRAAAWRGIVISTANIYMPKGKLDFGANGTGLSLKSEQTFPVTDLELGANGLTGLLTNPTLTLPAEVYGFAATMTGFRMALLNGKVDGKGLQKNQITMAIHIPFFGEDYAATSTITTDAVLSPTLDLGGKTTKTIFGTAQDEPFLAQYIVSSATISDGEAMFYGTLKATDKNNAGYVLPDAELPGLRIKPSGAISLKIANLEGWTNLPYNYSGSFQGYPFTVTGIGLKQNPAGGYTLGYRGGIVLSDNLSNTGGTTFDVALNFSSTLDANGTATNHVNTVSSSDVKLAFENGVTKFDNAAVTYQKLPEGYCFTVDLNCDLSSFTDVGKVSGKLIIGRQNTTNYWYIGMKVGGLNIPTGALDVAITSIEGRMYYHMSHPKGNIHAINYTADPKAAFGMYAGVTLLTSGDQGYRFYGDCGLEILTSQDQNGAFSGIASIIFDGDVQLLSTNSEHNNGPLWGTVNITYDRDGDTPFSATIDAHANLHDALCAHAPAGFYVYTNGWELNVGTKVAPVTISFMGCGVPIYTGYVDLTNSGFSTGASYTFDTGDQTWACFYGRATAGMGYDIDMAFDPFFLSGDGHIDGSVSAGFHACFIKCKNLEVISGEVHAKAHVELPPVCFAGKVSGKGCLFSKICKTVTFKIRYRQSDGFALQDKC